MSMIRILSFLRVLLMKNSSRKHLLDMYVINDYCLFVSLRLSQNITYTANAKSGTKTVQVLCSLVEVYILYWFCSSVNNGWLLLKRWLSRWLSLIPTKSRMTKLLRYELADSAELMPKMSCRNYGSSIVLTSFLFTRVINIFLQRSLEMYIVF